MLDKQKELVKTYFSDIADEYSHYCNMKGQNSVRAYIFSSRKKYVLSMLDLKNSRILDIGCGPAVLTEELLNNGCEVWSIDISETMVESAKKRMAEKIKSGKLHFAVDDIERLNFPDEYFDGILCIGVLEYLDDNSFALKEINRVLKHKGEIIFTVPNMASPFSLLDKLMIIILKNFLRLLSAIKIKIKIPQNRLLFRDDINDKYYLPWRFNKQLLKNGFDIDKTIFHIYRPAVLNVISPSLALFFTKKLEVLSKTHFSWMGINYIVKAYKQ